MSWCLFTSLKQRFNLSRKTPGGSHEPLEPTRHPRRPLEQLAANTPKGLSAEIVPEAAAIQVRKSVLVSTAISIGLLGLL